MRENNLNSPQQWAYFQELQVFDNKMINELCDDLANEVRKLTSNEIMVCGSVSKIFAGEFSEQYTPKDIDFVVSKWDFRILSHQLSKFRNVLMVEKLPHKIILYTKAFICIEIFYLTDHNKNMTKKYYQNLIPYLYGNQI